MSKFFFLLLSVCLMNLSACSPALQPQANAPVAPNPDVPKDERGERWDASLSESLCDVEMRLELRDVLAGNYDRNGVARKEERNQIEKAILDKKKQLEEENPNDQLEMRCHIWKNTVLIHCSKARNVYNLCHQLPGYPVPKEVEHAAKDIESETRHAKALVRILTTSEELPHGLGWLPSPLAAALNATPASENQGLTKAHVIYGLAYVRYLVQTEQTAHDSFLNKLHLFYGKDHANGAGIALVNAVAEATPTTIGEIDQVREWSKKFIQLCKPRVLKELKMMKDRETVENYEKLLFKNK